MEEIGRKNAPLTLGLMMGGLFSFLGIVIIINEINGLGLNEN